MEATPFVSVVTPFYNTREFLAECIESVLRQTHQNWEYVLVDNCSTDGSSELAEQYAFQFPDKIRLIHTQSFLTQVQNYNFALSHISPKSKYCKIVQADDLLFTTCIRSMIELAEAHPSVGIVAAYQLENDEVLLSGLPYPSLEVSGRDACRFYFLQGKYLFGSPTSTLILSDVIRSHHPFYEERLSPFEDAHVCFDLLRTWNFGFVHQVLTYSRRQSGSTLSRMQSFGFWLFSRLSFVVEHGRHYLSPDEYGLCLKQAERDYFLYLTKSACAIRRRAPEFWEFHRRALMSVNYEFDWKNLVRYFPRALVEKTEHAFWSSLDKPFCVDPRAVLGRR